MMQRIKAFLTDSFSDLLSLCGAALIVAGAAFWSPPLAMVLAGVALLLIARKD